jgi:hypothetical protein
MIQTAGSSGRQPFEKMYGIQKKKDTAKNSTKGLNGCAMLGQSGKELV